MGGLLLLSCFLICGILCADGLFHSRYGLIRLWLGLCLGLGMMMWFPALAAFFLRFGRAAQYCGLGAAAVCAAAAQIGCRHAAARKKRSFFGGIPPALVAALVLPALALSAYLQYTHVIRPVNGALYVGQSTYGDLCLHLGIATGMADAEFPPAYTILYGAQLGYPFLSDTMVSSMLVFGTDLRAAFVVTGVLMMGLVYLGFVIFAWEIAPGRAAVTVAFLLMFVNGGLGFGYVFAGMGDEPSALVEAFEGYYRAPANMPDYNLRWVNVVCDMMIPQRTLLAGWMMLLPALWMLSRAIREKRAGMFARLGVWAGAMPLVHTHSFLALGLLSGGVMLWEMLSAQRGRRWATARRFLLYGGLAVALALPQLLKWTFPQTAEGGALKVWFNWINNTGHGLIDEYFWFWIKNMGPAYLLLIPAAWMANSRGRALALGALAIWVTAEVIVFQPNVYDNNKLFYVAFMAMTPLVGQCCVRIWDKLRRVPGRAILATLFLTVSLLSGAMSLGREAVSEYMIFSASEAAAGEYIRDNTPRESVVLTGDQHNNPVTTLAGRQIICGTGSYLYFHGVDYSRQMEDQRAMLEQPADSQALFEEYGVDYVYLSSWERGSYAVDERWFMDNWELVFAQGSVWIYAAPQNGEKM